ncbi:NADH:ubiquinone reductase (Na(+)-transporting) subunit C [Bacteroidota bacterium]
MKRSNLYTFIYASVMVIIVAAVLSFAATKLKPYQEKNIAIAKKLDILKSVKLDEGVDEASDKESFIEELFEQYISESIVINGNGEVQSGINAFDIQIKGELKKDPADMKLPVFICSQKDGSKNYIFPVFGKGLWGPLWGYIALEENMNSIFGVTFDHKSETPGLGAEINKSFFMDQFTGKNIFESGKFVSIEIQKSGLGGGPSSVDGITGGTITSKALEETIRKCLENYLTYFNNKK